MYRLYGTCTRSNCPAALLPPRASIVGLGGHVPRQPPDAAQARAPPRDRCLCCSTWRAPHSRKSPLHGNVGAPTPPSGSIWPAVVISLAETIGGKHLGAEDFPAPTRAIHPARLNKRRARNARKTLAGSHCFGFWRAHDAMHAHPSAHIDPSALIVIERQGPKAVSPALPYTELVWNAAACRVGPSWRRQLWRWPEQ